MGREVRRVPANWQHPTQTCKHSPWNGGCKEPLTPPGTCFKPLYEGSWYLSRKESWLKSLAEKGLQETLEYEGRPPNTDDYMPVWTEAEATHYMMYEDTSEGTPISPAFATPEELARWLTDTCASSFGGMTASYEGWLRVARGGWAVSAVIRDGVIESGVEALTPAASNSDGEAGAT
jgi:hypothetical protein